MAHDSNDHGSNDHGSHKQGSSKQDSGKPAFWDTRYRSDVTPWDQGGVPARLIDYARTRTDRPRVLVPGCGAAYEVKYLVEHGWNVRAIDFSAAAIDAGRAILGPHAAILEQADFFDFAGDTTPFDVIYERAFLCALPPHVWPQYAARMAELLSPGGVIAGFFFVEPTEKGPPFGIAPEALTALLGPSFERIADQPVDDSIPIFRGKERWQIWRRR